MRNFKLVSYQRNGVAGDGFYVATCNEFGEPFLVTFETEDNGKDVIISSTRAVCLTNVAEKWRGDDFGYAVMKEIHHKGRKAYDLIDTKGE